MQHREASDKSNKPARSPSSPGNLHAVEPAAALTPYQQSILALQKSIGNQAVQRLMNAPQPNLALTQTPTIARVVTGVRNPPDWAEEERSVRTMQRQLRRLGLYHLRLDGDYGPGTDAAMVEAFGGDSFRTLRAEEAQTRLDNAEPSPGRRGEHQFRYGEMFKDGVLDITLGLGYDEALEADNPEEELEQMTAVLESRGFVDDRALAARLYREAGRAIGPSAFGHFFVKEDALTYLPPAGEPRQVHAVVRLVTNPTGSQGAAAAGAFREGMAQSDVSFYSGHGRYGSGPDFDRNFARFDLLDAEGNVTQTILDYEVLERVLRQEGRRRGRGAWAQFRWRLRNDRINADLSNAGNLFLNPRDRHSHEFGARLIYWALQQQEGGSELQTGEGGALAQGMQQAEESDRRYRVVVFNGCRTQDYEQSVRDTPGMERGSTDLITTRRSVLGGPTVWNTLAAFLDSIIGQQSAEETIRGMDREQEDYRSDGRAFRRSGSSYDPRVR
jgi:hypothetical protein